MISIRQIPSVLPEGIRRDLGKDMWGKRRQTRTAREKAWRRSMGGSFVRTGAVNAALPALVFGCLGVLQS